MRLIPSTKYYYACEEGHIWRNGTKRIAMTNGRGYLRIKVSVDGAARDGYIHRLVCEAYHGPCPEGMQCRHLNGNRQDNRPSNLEWSTKAINEADKRIHGTLQLGEKHHHAKLTDAIVIEARRRAAAGESVVDIAADLGLPYRRVLGAVSGRRYGHIAGAPRLMKGGQRRMLRRKAEREGKPLDHYIAPHFAADYSAPSAQAVALRIVKRG